MTMFTKRSDRRGTSGGARRVALFVGLIGSLQAPGCFARNVILAADGATDDLRTGDAPTGDVETFVSEDAGADVPRDGAGDDGGTRPYAACNIFGEPPPAKAPAVQRSCLDAPAIRGCGVVDVPGGTIVVGDDGIVLSDGVLGVGAIPVQPDITVSAFRVDAMEVSVARFRRFANAVAAGWVRPEQFVMPDCQRSLDLGQLRFELPRLAGAAPGATYTAEPGPNEAHPVNWIIGDTAWLFCAYEGGRLPTNAEWEHLARYRPVPGLSPGRHFASGDELPTGCRGSWTRGCSAVGTARLYTAPVDDTDDIHGGVYHLTGNVLEMILDFHQDYRERTGASPHRGTCWEQLPQRDPLCLFADPMIAGGARWTTFRGPGLVDFGPLRYAASRYHSNAINVPWYDIGLRCVYPPR